MDPSLKKRKADENNGVAATTTDLTVDDCLKILAPLTADQLRPIVASSMLRDPAALSAVRSIADPDQSLRKLFIRGLGWDTTADSLRSLFSAFGDLEEAVVIADKTTGKSKGYGFITFRHVDGALLALKEPSKKIDGRMTVTQLAAAGNSGNPAAPPAADVSLRKIYVANVPADMPSDRLLHLFSSFGEIEEGPLGFDKQTGKFRGFALFVYKTPEAAQACLLEPNKMIDGHHLLCKLAIEGKKPKAGGPGGAAPPVGGGQGQGVGDGMGYGSQMPGQYGGPGAVGGSYGGFSGSGYPGGGGAPVGNHHNMNSSTMGSANPGQIPAHGGAGAGGYSSGGYGAGSYGAGTGGPYGSSAQYGGSGAGAGGGGAAGGYGGFGMNSSMYRGPPSSGGMGAGGYPEGGHYPSAGYQNQHHQQTGSSPGARVPSGGMYQNIPPFY